MVIPSDASFALQVQIAREVIKTKAECTGECWRCWVSWNPRECAEEVRDSRDILDELPWIE